MSTGLDIQGKLIVKEDTQSVGRNGFLKRKIVVETSDQYPQKIPVEFVQDKSDLPDPYQIGEEVTVSTNVRGNEHNGNYYLSLQGWRIQRVPLSGGQPPAPAPTQPQSQTPAAPQQAAPVASATPPTEEDDDIPF